MSNTSITEEAQAIIDSAPTKRTDYHGGFHSWIWTAALQLREAHPSAPEDYLVSVLLVAAEKYRDRHIPVREVEQAVLNSHPEILQERNTISETWDPIDSRLQGMIERQACILDFDDPLAPYQSMTTAECLLALFHPKDLLCLCSDPEQGRPVVRRTGIITTQVYRRKLAEMRFVVPNPMSKPSGVTQTGQQSSRCLDNTGPRRYQVIEFDSGSTETQLKRHRYLASFGQLVLLVHSGGKSVHGWYLAHRSFEDQRNFFNLACRIGADPIMWVRCQWTRLPGGYRDDSTKQRILYYQPPANT